MALCLVALPLWPACRHPAAGHDQVSAAKKTCLDQSLQSGRMGDFRLSEKSSLRIPHQFTFTNRDSVLKIEVFPNLDREAAETLLQDAIMGVHALYANALSPYPGDISHRIESNPKFRPQFFTRTVGGVTFSYFVLFANERLGYGATADDLVRYRSLVGWLHCGPSGNFYKVRLFKPLTTENRELEELFLSLRCP
jgi:hypothetical protein